MKKAFEEVRKEIANLNTFVQERISGMKIVQLFGREDIEQNTFDAINNRHKKAWLKTVWFNSIFFPVAEISTSVTIGLLVWYGDFNTLNGGVFLWGLCFCLFSFRRCCFVLYVKLPISLTRSKWEWSPPKGSFKIIATESSIDDNGNVHVTKWKERSTLRTSTFLIYREKPVF